jgi:hypothetical protein
VFERQKRAALKILRAMVEEDVLVFGEPEPGTDYTTIKDAQHMKDHPFLVRIRDSGVWCYEDIVDDGFHSTHILPTDYIWPTSAHERLELTKRINAELEAMN